MQIFRSLFRDRLNNLVIIVSLSVGMAAVNLIILFLSREFGTDNFHEFKDRIYLLKCDDPWFPGKKMFHCKAGSVEYMKTNFAKVEDFCRYKNSNPLKVIVNNNEYFDHPQLIGASENFFRFFSYKLLTNNPWSALESMTSLVISSDLAKKYFGSDNPIGKVITFVTQNPKEEMIVTGVFKKPVGNTQLNFDMVRLMGDTDSRCYVRLAEGADAGDLEKLFSERKEGIPAFTIGGPAAQYYLEPFRKAYFDTQRGLVIEFSRNKTDLWISLIIGLMILGISVFNYLGILTNRFYVKTKEYYVRRINGASMHNLAGRFMLENLILVILSLLISLVLMNDILPFFNNLTTSNITEVYVMQKDVILVCTGLPVFILITTWLFVIYLVHTNLCLKDLKAEQNHIAKSAQIPIFNIFQLFCSIALIICSFIIIKQMNYITNKPIGLNKEVIEIKIPYQYSKRAAVFKDELLKYSSIKNVSIVNASPVLEHFLVALKYQQNGAEKQYSPSGFSGDEKYLDVLGIELVSGAGFSETSSANEKKCLINESFARLFHDQDLIGKPMPGMEDMIITGIVKDFNYSDLKSHIEPAFISFDNKGGHLMVRESAGHSDDARQAITDIWLKLIPDYPVDIESVGDRFEWFHRNNANLKRLIGSCAIISLFLSLIGLFALSYQKTHSRTKEIGIRKINGSSDLGIISLITRDFIRWTTIATIAAIPAGWFAMDSWLGNYAYKTDMSWWIFFLSGIIVLGTVLLTVSIQSYKAATRNPVEALRYE